MLNIFLLSILLIFCINNNIIKIPFFEEEKSTIEDYIFNNKLITNIKIGTPFQIIPATITFETYYFLISNTENTKYKKLDSKTYHETLKDFSYITFFDKIFEGMYSTEKFEFNNENNKNITSYLSYYLIEKHNNRLNLNSASIGLHYRYFNLKEYEANLLFQLKENNIINLNIFSFHFNNNNNNKGELIIGKIPHEINNFFNINSYKYTFIEDIKNDFCYGISFENIFFGNFSNYKSEKETFKAEFNIDINGFIGSNKYKNFVNENFFDNYLKLNKCFIKNISYNNNNYIQYYCNKEIDIKNNILNINFYNKILNSTFEIDYEILWKEIDNFYYFLMIFNDENNFWVFGLPFFKKYLIVFDIERKLLGFYLNNENINFNINNNKYYYYSNILIFILTLFIIFLLFFIKKKIKNNKKIRVNELEENIDYTINDDDIYKKLNNK